MGHGSRTHKPESRTVSTVSSSHRARQNSADLARLRAGIQPRCVILGRTDTATAERSQDGQSFDT
ncbi:hypothetical protein WOLCODRAFT_135576 [Wolfiporia cocos MD-104 SS10]|uniref:Uncharacterized protein n=1 Tax=Wolfiporia cocos (strain MD-104) TaxID=742152 RepID=A0A2H3JE31_WOLCO|nr:hypothetical protein WOLCODRAFT_135576 [Wolfiporia cocos MD-104 SS10]